MRRFRVQVLTGFIACGLLLLNLGSVVFSCVANVPVASYAAVPADADDDDAGDAGLAAADCLPAFHRSLVLAALRQETPVLQSFPATDQSFLPLVTRHASLNWHFAERAAAAPRAPSFLA